MTRKEFQQRFGKEAVTLLQNPTFLILLDVAREDCPYVPNRGGSDATTVIRHDGLVEGWMECLKFLKSSSQSEPEPKPPTETSLYADPDKRKQSDQNK